MIAAAQRPVAVDKVLTVLEEGLEQYELVVPGRMRRTIEHDLRVLALHRDEAWLTHLQWLTRPGKSSGRAVLWEYVVDGRGVAADETSRRVDLGEPLKAYPRNTVETFAILVESQADDEGALPGRKLLVGDWKRCKPVASRPGPTVPSDSTSLPITGTRQLLRIHTVGNRGFAFAEGAHRSDIPKVFLHVAQAAPGMTFQSNSLVTARLVPAPSGEAGYQAREIRPA